MRTGAASPQPLVVLQNNFVTRLTAPAAIAARGMGIQIHDISSGDAARANPIPGGRWGPVLVIGSVLFARQWGEDDPDLRKWVFWDDEQYDARLWAERLGTRFLNHAGTTGTVGSFIASAEGQMHIRPRSGMKMVGEKQRSESQAGQMSVPGIVADPESLARIGIDPATPIWISPPRPIEAEVRVWMIGGMPAAASTYRVAGEHLRSRDHPLVAPATAAAQETCSIWTPGRHFVIDMALSDGGWSMIEANPIHASGWYDARIEDVIAAYMAAEGGPS